MNSLDSFDNQVSKIIALALAEDRVRHDITTRALVPPQLDGKASLLVKAPGVLAGIEIAKQVFLKVDPELKVEVLLKDGARIKSGDVAARISGRVGSILKAERTALNFLQRLSGIATITSKYVEAVKGTRSVIADTRKTTPGLRMLEKYAVRVGGGHNHRLHLGDSILIKDNHLVALRNMSLKEIAAKAKQKAAKDIKVEVEVSSYEQALEAAQAGANAVMLDNMGIAEMRRVVTAICGKVKIEASGGITLENVRQVAETGVDIISIGALTHSPKALDISLELES